MLNKKKVIIASILLVIVIGLVYVMSTAFFQDEERTPRDARILKEIEGYDYTLDDTKTALFINLFDELEGVLTAEEIDEEQYATLVAKLFIVDFFDLESKLTGNDVGGVQFVHEKAREDFILKARDTIYKYVESDLYDDRDQKLPSVLEVTLNDIEASEFVYESIQDSNAYHANLQWQYKEDLSYQNSATLVLVREGNKLSIVELFENE